MNLKANHLGAASGLALAIALSSGAGAARAQTVPTAAGNQTQTIGEVVVTASRTKENIQTVPAAVTALSSTDLEKKDVGQVADLQNATPALTITSAALSQNVNIRGIGLSSGNPNVVPGVPVYIDGLVQPPIVTTNSFFDIGEIEVYRGPQGTFAGANSTGGAVFVNSNSPTTGAVGGNVEAWGGSYSDIGARGALNMPIDDQLAVRLAFNVERRDSFFHTIGGPYADPTGGSYQTPGSLDEQDLRLGVLWKPIEHLTILLKVAGGYKNTGGYDYRPIPGTEYAQYASPNLRTLDFDTPEENIEKSLRNSLEIRYELPDGITLRSVSGFQYNKVNDIYDIDASDGPPAQTEAQDVSERPISQEFNIISPDSGRLKWIAGAFYYHDSIKVGLDTDTAGSPHNYITILTEKISEAAFGRVQYNLTNDLQLEVGGRYTHDEVNDGGQLQIVIPGLPPLATIPLPGHYAGDNWTGKASLNYNLNADNFLYAFAAKGAKAGGANGGAADFLPETVWSYEVGWKTLLLDRRVRVQLDGFYNNYNNYQIDALDPTSGQGGVLNTKSATIKGAELQIEGRLGGLAVDFGGAWVDSSVGAVSLVNSRQLPGGGAVSLGPQCATGVASNPPTCFDYGPYIETVGGRPNAYAPKWTYNFGVEYNFDVGAGSTLTPRIDYAYQSQQYTTLLENPQDLLASHGVWNAHLTFAHDRYSLVGYVTNFTNKVYVSGQFINAEFLGPPRQFGVRAAYRF